MLIAGENELGRERQPGELEPEVAVAFFREVGPRGRQAWWWIELEHVALMDLVPLHAGEGVVEFVVVCAELGDDAGSSPAALNALRVSPSPRGGSPRP